MTVTMTIKYSLWEQFMENVHFRRSSIFDTPQQHNLKSFLTINFTTGPRAIKFVQL